MRNGDMVAVVSLYLGRISNIGPGRGAAEHTAVTDLATAFSIKRRAIEHHNTTLTRRQLLNLVAFMQERKDCALC